MKHQMLSIMTCLSVASAPMTAFAGKGEGTSLPGNCDSDIKDSLLRSENAEWRDDFQKYYLDKPSERRPVDEQEFCRKFAERFTEAGYCADGDCSKSKHRPPVNPEEGRDIERVSRENADDELAPRRYRDDQPRVVEKVVYRDRPSDGGGFGGGLGGLFNGNPMGYMLAGGLGGLLGAMMAGNNNNQQMMRPPMFRSPYGPYGPMRPGGMMGNGMPPRYMPYNRAGAAPGIIGAGGIGGFGGIGGAPGVISPYNGATIYNGGAIGGTNYFNTPPAVINASTGMRMFSVGGAAPAPQYQLLGR